MSLIIKNLKKKFGGFIGVDNVSLQVSEGEFLALLGPSGSGKTTLLRIIAGLEWPDEGEIYLEGRDSAREPIKERRIGFVFQHFALFKHMTVIENIAFGLKLKRPRLSKEEIKNKVDALLDLIHLKDAEYKYPSELSGGQRQRVALARVLAIEPKYMLLDEPFGALDAKVRKELRRWLKNLHDKQGLTTIFVTHDQEEAMELSDRIAIMDQGRIVQLGTPLQLWEHPLNSFVYDFLGHYNTFIGYEIEDGILLLDHKAISEIKKSVEYDPAKEIKAFARPQEIFLERAPLTSHFFLQTTLTLINRASPYIKLEFLGPSETYYQVEMDKTDFEWLNPQLGETIWLKPICYRSFKA